jgi:WD40 repeat protein
LQPQENAVLILQSQLETTNQLAFSPDGLSLAARGPNSLQVWPRWHDTSPRPVVKELVTLVDFAFSPDGKQVFLYLCADSRTRVLTVETGKERPFPVPSTGPSWFHFTGEGGFFIVDHGRGKLSRYDLFARPHTSLRSVRSACASYAPKAPRRVALRWTIDRKTHGSHYAFGGVCDSAGVYVALEYRFSGGELIDGIVVRSVEDGTEIRREKVRGALGKTLPYTAGREMSVHPSGKYFAYAKGTRIRLWPLTDGLDLPTEIANTKRSGFRTVAFNPTGTLLSAAGHDGTVKLYNTATWQVNQTFAWKIGKMRCVCFSRDGLHMAAGSDKGQIVVWDVDG